MKYIVGILLLLFECSVGYLSAQENHVLFKPDVFWGTNNGNIIPGASLPWGMVRLSPDIKTMNTPTSGYHDAGNIVGFSHTHSNGVGGSPRYGNILVIPQTDSLTLDGFRQYAKKNETGYPGYYSVMLIHKNTSVRAELTASEKVGYHRYHFHEDYDKDGSLKPYFVIDVSNVNRRLVKGIPSTYCSRGNVVIADNRTIEGEAECIGGWGGKNPYTIYFCLQFDRPFQESGVFCNGTAYHGQTRYSFNKSGTDEERFGAFVAFDTTCSDIDCKVAISYKSLEQARAHLAQQQPYDFDAACRHAGDVWTSHLSRIQVKGSDINAQRIFYSAMRSAIIMPTRVTGEVDEWDFPHFWDFTCIWDTYRTLSPLYTLIYPEVQRNIIRCLLDIYEKRGYLPDGWVANDYTTVQGGSNADVVLADAVVKNLGGFDKYKALEATIKNAEVESPTPDKCGRYCRDYNRYGFVCSETTKSAVSKTLEYAYDDYCIARMALSCGNPRLYAKYARRALGIYTLFHPEHKMFWAKDSLGRWKSGFYAQPNRSDTWNDPYFYEGGAMIYSTYVPHDMAGLIKRHGGTTSFKKYLDNIFENDVFKIENEFEFLVPYLYIYTGDYESTARVVRKILKEKFLSGRNGLPGQDDAGAMSSWYIFSALGFFPVAGQDLYLLGTPLFEESRLMLENNKTFTVKALNLSDKNIYITRAILNGKPLNTAWFRHSDICNGGELILEMSDSPSDWGTQDLPPSLSDEFQTVAYSYPEADVRADSLLSQMSLSEKISMIGGHNSFYIKGFPKYGIPELYMSDATAGVHIRKELSHAMERSVSFPAPVALAATWNPLLSYEMAKSIGEECRVGGISILLGPGVNIYRISQNGRNFEYFGEDPYLASRITEGYVVGMQSTGTMSTLKHFVCNNNEHHRRLSNSIVSKRALNEIYLPAFKAGIDAGAGGVMTSYNQVNGEYTAESYGIVTRVLREQLGFRGIVMSDWRSVYDAQKAILSGLDLEMPGDYADWLLELGDTPFRHLKHEAKRLLDEAKISERDIDRMVKNIVRTSIMMGFYDRPIQDTTFLKDFPQHERVALQVGRESIVLLKNKNQILPLNTQHVAPKSILLTGLFAERLPAGGGSAYVEGYNNVTMREALEKKFGPTLHYVAAPSDEEIKSADYVILSLGTFDREGVDRPFALPDSVEMFARKVTQLNPRTIVVVNSGGGIQMTHWADEAAAILYAWFPGQCGNIALSEILAGDVNPSGKLPFTIEKDFHDSPGYGYKPDQEALEMPWQDEYSFRFPMNNIEYKEDILVGYRWYEKKKIEPLYPFGHGLSYTQFEYKDLHVPKTFKSGQPIVVEFTVTNTGTKAGAETVQLYVQDEKSSVLRPIKELKAFRKIFLAPQETVTVRFHLSPMSFAFYDEQEESWKTERGYFTLHIGASSQDIRLKGRCRQL